MEKEKVKFKQLSGWLKVGIIGGWCLITVYILSFMGGFILGIINY